MIFHHLPREKANVIFGEQELFYTSKNMIFHLMDLAEEVGIKQEESVVLKEEIPYKRYPSQYPHTVPYPL